MSSLRSLFNLCKSVKLVTSTRQVRCLSIVAYQQRIIGTNGAVSQNPVFNPESQKYFRNQQRHVASSTSSKENKAGEDKIKSMLAKAFPSAKAVIVEDISGGCGSMYQVHIESIDFEGLSIVKQHQLVNKALEDEIKIMHGIRISTKIATRT